MPTKKAEERPTTAAILVLEAKPSKVVGHAVTCKVEAGGCAQQQPHLPARLCGGDPSLPYCKIALSS